MSEIEKIIDDQALTNELRQMINLRIIDLDKNYTLISGITQNSILSFFLFNIYMTPFDNFICDLKKKFAKEEFKVNNFEYKKRTNFELKKSKGFDFKKRIKLLKIKRDKMIAEGILPYREISEFIKIYYVRYVDNILFGFNSSKEVAKKVIFESEVFIKASLHFSHFSIKLTHAKSGFVKFLGFRLSVFDGNFYTKGCQLTNFQKVKTNLKRKKIVESEKYFKLVKCLFLKMQRQLINSIRLESQTLIKESQIRKVYDNRVKCKVFSFLKASLFKMEAEFILTQVKSNIFKKDENMKCGPHIIFAKQNKNSFLKNITQKWIVTAQKLAIKADADEIDCLVGKYFSSNFVKIRKEYLQELEKISLIKLSDKIEYNAFENEKIWGRRKQILKKSIFGHSVRIIFPVEEIRKKLRSLGVLHKIVTKPIGLLKLTLMSVYEIIN